MDYIDYSKLSYLSEPKAALYTEGKYNSVPPSLVQGKDGVYHVVFQAPPANSNKPIQDSAENSIINANDCVNKSQDVLGLKINEIAKLLNISRAALDLHRNGANIKDMDAYQKLYVFIVNVEALYGNSLKNNGRNILIHGKTLIQHLIENKNDLSLVMPTLELLSRKAKGMQVSSTEYESSKLMTRTRHVGRFA